MQNIAINGFGRIGRLALRVLISQPDINVVAINDLTDADTLAHLFKYDSTHGIWDQEVHAEGNELVIGSNRIPVYSERDPEALPWANLNVDLVIECTGIFTKREGAEKHIHAGAAKVLLSAPAKSMDIKTIVLGVNDHELDANERVISNASCTTNCLAPMLKVLNDAFGVDYGYMNTIHAYTGDQRLQDAPHKDLRRARAAARNMIPTSTGAAKAVARVLPEFEGKLQGGAVRVPIIDGSLTELTLQLSKTVDVEAINQAFEDASKGSMQNILEYTEAPIVSSDIVGNKHSCIVDSGLTRVMGTLVRVVGWYDNEMGYASRLAELGMKICELNKNTSNQEN